MTQNKGASAEPTGLAGAEAPEPHSRLVASPAIPCAVTIPGELYAFLMGEAPLEGVWFGEMNEGFKGAFWWRALLRCAAGWPTKEASPECPFCQGRGERWVHADGLPRAPYPVQCDYCRGTGAMAVSADASAIEAATAGETVKQESSDD